MDSEFMIDSEFTLFIGINCPGKPNIHTTVDSLVYSLPAKVKILLILAKNSWITGIKLFPLFHMKTRDRFNIFVNDFRSAKPGPSNFVTQPTFSREST